MRLAGMILGMALALVGCVDEVADGAKHPAYTPDCESSSECDTDLCYRYASTASPDVSSYCTSECTGDLDCPGDGRCFEIDGDPDMTRACFDSCATDADCLGGWLCTEAIDAESGDSLGFICLPE